MHRAAQLVMQNVPIIRIKAIVLVELNDVMAQYYDAVVSYNQPGARKIDEFVERFVALMQGALA